MEGIYFAMFSQVGACVLILALSEGRHRALKLTGTIITGYCLALGLFFIWPAAGPSAICANHFTVFPSGSMIYSIQHSTLSSLQSIRTGHSLQIIGSDYYIAFPSMHLVDPLIVLWFMRRWKRMFVALVAFNVLLVPCILLLEQHYLVDLIAAVPVAMLAIAISARCIPILTTKTPQ